MFLWVRLVLLTLKDADNIQELRQAVDTFPKDLAGFYRRILEEMKERSSSNEYDKSLRVLSWMSCSKIPLKAHELEWGTALHAGNTAISRETRPLRNVVETCKPLIEDGPNKTVIFVHSSVKE